MKKPDDERWMRTALLEAADAARNGELPIAAVIVAGEVEIARAQTSPARKESMVAHAELLALMAAGWGVFSAHRPVTIYTTLEPCLMCLGAALQCEIDRIVFGMRASVDGASGLVDVFEKRGMRVPAILGGVLESDAVVMMRALLEDRPDHLGAKYVRELLVAYGDKV